MGRVGMTSPETDCGEKNFIDWWLMSLSELLTPKAGAMRAWRTLFLSRGDGFAVFKNSRGKPVSVAVVEDAASKKQMASARKALKAASRGPRQTVIRLSSDDVLERTIQIPSAASDVVEPVLQNQLDRIVPWPKNETYFGYQIVDGKKHSGEQLEVRVIATRKAILDNVLRQAHDLGLNASLVDFAPPEQLRAGVELLSLMPDPVRRRAEGLKVAGLGLALCSATVTVLGSYFLWQQALQQNELDAQAQVLRDRVAAMDRRLEQNLRLQTERARLVQRKTNSPAVTVLLEALSRALPDNAYLSELTISGPDVRLEGKAEEPTALIPKIESAAQFTKVRFGAPTTRTEEEEFETFSITATGQAAFFGELER